METPQRPESAHHVPYRFIPSPTHGGRTIIVGDIHGCMDEFTQLLDRISFRVGEDLVISVGDFMDRGPASWEVARFFRYTEGAYAVCGNHERRLAGTVRRTSEPAWSQRLTLHQFPYTDRREWAAWVESLPAVIETDDAIITHARLDPERGLEDQDLYHTAGVMGKRAQKLILTDEGIPAWYFAWRQAHGGEKPVCIGHLGYGAVELVEESFYALDTGAAAEGELTALVMPGKEIVAIRSPRNYHIESREIWKDMQETPVEEMQIKKILAGIGKDEALAAACSVYLAEHRFEERLQTLAITVPELFGPVPAPGSERGVFYRDLRERLPFPVFMLVKYILWASKDAETGDLMKHFSKERLNRLREMLEDLESVISSKQILKE